MKKYGRNLKQISFSLLSIATLFLFSGYYVKNFSHYNINSKVIGNNLVENNQIIDDKKTTLLNDNININENLYNCIIDAYNETNDESLTYDDELTEQQLLTITELSCSDISDTTGIENLKNLTFLEIDGNLKTIDLTALINLEVLSIENTGSENLYETIDLSNNQNLKALVLYNFPLQHIDLDKNTLLEELYFTHCNIAQVNLNKLINLKYLWIVDANLTTIDISKNTKLQLLDLTENKLTNIDLTNNNQLITLALAKNELTSLDISNNLSLQHLIVQKNKLKTLDLSNNTNLKYIDIFDNPLKKELVVYKGSTIDFYYDKGFVKYYDYSSSTNYIKSSLMTEEGSFSSIIGTGENAIFSWEDTSNGKYIIESDSSDIVIDGSKITFNNKGQITINAKYASRYFKDSTLDIYYFYTGTDRFTYAGEYIFNVIEATSDKYLINNEEGWIYVGNHSHDLIADNVKIEYAKIDIDNDKMIIKSDNEILKEFNIKNIDFGNLNSNSNYIIIENSINYDEFISNISMSDDFTYKLFNGESEITSGKVEKEMILKIYYNNEEIDSYIVTNEYFDIDETITVDNDNMYFSNIEINTDVNSIIEKIDTTGEIIIKNNKNEVITNEQLVGTGSVVSIQLGNDVYDYTIIIKGDIDGNGQMNLSDIMKIANYVYKDENSLNGVFVKAADFDNNGIYNLQDIMKFAKELYGGN